VSLQTQSLGRLGEENAVGHLKRLGYRIIGRNVRTRFGEIDVVCRDRGHIVFVEVKTRSSDTFGTAAEAVTPEKSARLKRLA